MTACSMIVTLPTRVQLESPDLLDFQGKRDPLVFVETMDPPEDRESEVHQVRPAAQETKGTLEKMGPR